MNPTRYPTWDLYEAARQRHDATAERRLDRCWSPAEAAGELGGAVLGPAGWILGFAVVAAVWTLPAWLVQGCPRCAPAGTRLWWEQERARAGRL